MWVGKVEFTIKFKSFQLTNNFYFNWKTVSLTCRYDTDKFCGDVCIEIRVRKVLHDLCRLYQHLQMIIIHYWCLSLGQISEKSDTLYSIY